MLDAKYTRSLYMLHKNDDNNKLEKLLMEMDSMLMKQSLFALIY